MCAFAAAAGVAAIRSTAAISAKTHFKRICKQYQKDRMRTWFINAIYSLLYVQKERQLGNVTKQIIENMLVFYKGIALVKCVLCVRAYEMQLYGCIVEIMRRCYMTKWIWVFRKITEFPSSSSSLLMEAAATVIANILNLIQSIFGYFVRDQFQLNLFTHVVWLIKLNLQLQLPSFST